LISISSYYRTLRVSPLILPAALRNTMIAFPCRTSSRRRFEKGKLVSSMLWQEKHSGELISEALSNVSLRL
jgi:hypothetical protein